MKHVISVQIVIMKAEDSVAFKKHVEYSHAAENTCNFCEFKHSMLNRVNLHMAEKYDEKNIQCDSCDFTSPTKRAMNSHVFRKHSKCCKLLKCEKCDYTSVNLCDV